MKHAADAQETIDGDLAARVFGLLQAVDTGAHAQRYGEHSRQRLDIAILGFFQGFRKVYIGEQVMHASKVRSGGRRGAAVCVCLYPLFDLNHSRHDQQGNFAANLHPVNRHTSQIEGAAAF